MPIGEIETHPYLNDGQVPKATRLILGSFPVYECTNPDNFTKQQNRNQEGTIRFFYGSIDSSFWRLYSQYVDNSIVTPPNPEEIITSLSNNKIAITDNIISCQRHSFSSEDTRLIKKEWNRQGIIDIVNNGIDKILCTSKGVLSDLTAKIICPKLKPFGERNVRESLIFQSEFIDEINGDIDNVLKPIANVFTINNRIVKALAIPSPGSPQRQIKRFGCNEQERLRYLNDYFAKAFQWFLE